MWPHSLLTPVSLICDVATQSPLTPVSTICDVETQSPLVSISPNRNVTTQSLLTSVSPICRVTTQHVSIRATTSSCGVTTQSPSTPVKRLNLPSPANSSRMFFS